MLRLTLAQMRRTVGRLVAAGVAIALGAAFVTATLLASGVMSATTVASLTAEYARADLVITGDLTERTAAALAEVPGVATVHPVRDSWVAVAGAQGSTTLRAAGTAPVPELEPVELVAGSAVTAADQIALTDTDAERIGVAVGDTVTVTVEDWSGQTAGDPRTAELTVVGLLDGDSLALFGAGAVRVAPEVGGDWFTYQSGADASFWRMLATVDPGADADAVQAAAAQAVSGDVTVRTLQQEADAQLEYITGETQVMTAVILAFAAVALLVAALVIANTFQVIVAQRTRTLALLRCVGATKAQLRRSVRLEAAILGLVASVVGVVLGFALVQGLLLWLSGIDTGVPLPRAVPASVSAVVVPVLVGVAVTMLAARTPARAATRVSPLAALQPVATGLGERGGKARAWVAGLLTVGGAAGLALGVVVATNVEMVIGLMLGIAGGAASFVGVVVGAVFWVPRLVGLLGGLATRLTGGKGTSASVPTRLAAANSVRNPRRTAATAAALFIGVTLVTMMATGAATARAAFTDTLDAQYPVDVQIQAWDETGGLPAGFLDDLAAVDGVAGVVPFSSTQIQMVEQGQEESRWGWEAIGVDPVAAGDVLNDRRLVERLTDGTAVFSTALAQVWGVEDGDPVTLAEHNWDTGPGPEVTLAVAVVDTGGELLLVTPADLGRLTPDAQAAGAWVSIEGGATARTVVEDIQDLATSAEADLGVAGTAVERAFFDEVIDTLLAVVVGLLAVSVVIALVGVSNTLSLSVIERRRESATLRAIGLTKGRLRASLAAEGVLVAVVGALVGAVLGTVYGWAGVLTILGEMTDVPFTVAWRDVGLVLLVAVTAGLIASVAPARSAVRTPPVAALAVD